MAPTTGVDWIIWILLGGLLGLIGQIIRASAGLKKLYDESGDTKAFRNNFEWSVLSVSLIIGFASGALASLTVTYPEKPSGHFLITFVAAGYAGADFVEAFVKKHLPGGRDRNAAPARTADAHAQR
jgi:uncharacterized membrane protein YeaQ/YmgE (transglycosylase-associated protein family)